MAKRLSEPIFPWEKDPTDLGHWEDNDQDIPILVDEDGNVEVKHEHYKTWIEPARQIHLSAIFKIAVRDDYVAGILPYAKSTGFWLPGHGFQYASCGEIRALGCDNVREHPGEKVFARYYRASCLRKVCPICFESWAASESERSLCRISAYLSGKDVVQNLYKHARHESMGKASRVFHEKFVGLLEHEVAKHRGMRVIHVVLSPNPKSPFGKNHYASLRSLAYKIGRKSGLKGGLAVFHPFRLHCKKCDVAIPDYKKTCPQCGGIDFWWVPGPHFHVVGFGWIPGPKEIYEDYGWVVRNLGIRESVFWTMQYLLSHAGVFVDPEGGFRPKTFHTTTWFGDLSYNKLNGIPEIQVPPASCPYCGRQLQPFEFVGLDRPPPDFNKFRPENNEFLDDLGRWRSVRCL